MVNRNCCATFKKQFKTRKHAEDYLLQATAYDLATILEKSTGEEFAFEEPVETLEALLVFVQTQTNDIFNYAQAVEYLWEKYGPNYEHFIIAKRAFNRETI